MATRRARDFLSMKIEKLVREGYSTKQAAAIAYSYVRKKRFRI